MANTTVACTNINLLKESQIPASPSQTELYAVELDGKPLTQANISNCITEIPQDIKLELNNGTLTLKAGSKVYVPNGVGRFDAVTIQSDMQYTAGWGDKRTLFFSPNRGIDGFQIENCFSGPNAPSGYQYMYWYDTTNNIIKWTINSGSTWEETWSLPICTVTGASNVVASIDQVFNGFGYIGSTVFALPGVKGLIPNGRNADGTLKSVEFTVSNVFTETFTSAIGAFNGYVAIQNKNGNIALSYDALNYWTYDINSNIFVHNDEKTSFCYLAALSTSGSGVISNWNLKTVFHALDYNDKGTISGWGMPDYTAGVSYSSNFVAPTNGYCVASNHVGAWGIAKLLADGGVIDQQHNPTSGTNILVYTRGFCKKGQTISKDGVSSWDNVIFYPLIGG